MKIIGSILALLLVIGLCGLWSCNHSRTATITGVANADFARSMMWLDYSSPFYQPIVDDFLKGLQTKGGLDRPPVCKIENIGGLANGASGPRLYRVSMSPGEFAAFHEGALRRGAQPTTTYQAHYDVMPLWWDPPANAEVLVWPNREEIIYDPKRALFFQID